MNNFFTGFFIGALMNDKGATGRLDNRVIAWIIIISMVLMIVFIPLAFYDLTKLQSFKCYTCHTKLERYKDAQFLNMEWGARNSTTSYYTYLCYKCSHKGTMKEVNNRKWLNYGYQAIS